MERALVVVDDTEKHRDLLEEAAELADGVGADLVLLSMITEEEYEEMTETIEAMAESGDTGFGSDTVLQVARNFAEDVARDALDDIDIDHEVVGATVNEGERADEIIRTAEEYGCDHVFLTGRRRSPTGKAIFGNTAQAVILNFPGTVTVAME